MKRFLFAAAFAGLGLISIAAPTRAGLVLAAGEASFTNIPTNHFGFSGTYYSPNLVSHPGGGPVAFLYVINPDLTISTYKDSVPGPYDGADDTQVAVLNRAGPTLNSFTLTGSATSNLFGYESDGISTSPYNAPRNSRDTTGYGGPLTYFTGINASFSSGTANFLGGLGSGASTYFALEEAPNLGSPPVPTAPNVGTPEPTTLIAAVMAAILGLVVRRGRAAA